MHSTSAELLLVIKQPVAGEFHDQKGKISGAPWGWPLSRQHNVRAAVGLEFARPGSDQRKGLDHGWPVIRRGGAGRTGRQDTRDRKQRIGQIHHQPTDTCARPGRQDCRSRADRYPRAFQGRRSVGLRREHEQGEDRRRGSRCDQDIHGQEETGRMDRGRRMASAVTAR